MTNTNMRWNLFRKKIAHFSILDGISRTKEVKRNEVSKLSLDDSPCSIYFDKCSKNYFDTKRFGENVTAFPSSGLSR